MSYRDKCIDPQVEYVYLLHTREFINSGDPVYKIGRTSQENAKRFTQYPKGYRILLQCSCNNSRRVESQIKTLFKAKYVQAREFGVEYFRGDATSMINDINRIVSVSGHSSTMPEGVASLKKNTVSAFRMDPNIFEETDTRETVPMDVVE
jgi:T5orf172 domain